MKKNILAVVILAATIVNIVLSGVTLFTVVPKLQKTDELVTKIAGMIDLETESSKDIYSDVTYADLASVLIGESTITLRDGSHAILTITIELYTKAEDYEQFNTYVAANTEVIKNIVNSEYAKYTADTIQDSESLIKSVILQELRSRYNTDAIYNIVINPLYAK